VDDQLDVVSALRDSFEASARHLPASPSAAS
jgi:hypothetical protein